MFDQKFDVIMMIIKNKITLDNLKNILPKLLTNNCSDAFELAQCTIQRFITNYDFREE